MLIKHMGAEERNKYVKLECLDIYVNENIHNQNV